MGAPVPLDKLPPSLRGTPVPADKLPPHLSGTPAAAPVENPAVGGAGPAASYPLSSADINQPADIPGVGLLVNSGQALLNAGGKAVSGYAGLLGTILPGPEGQGADWQQRANAALHTDYTPNRDPLVNVPGAIINAAAAPLNDSAPGRAVTNFVDNTPGVKEGLEGAMDISNLLGVVAPMGAARAGIVADRAAIADSSKLLGNRKGAAVPSAKVAGPGDPTVLNTPVAAASRDNLTVIPWEGERQVGGSESIKGSTRAGFGTGLVNKEVALKNAPRINEIALRDMPGDIQIDPRNGRIELGDPRAPAPGTINAAKKVEGAKYDAVRRVPGDGSSPELQQNLQGIATGLDSVPEAVARDVQRIVGSKAQGGPSTKLVDDIMELRQDATMNNKRAYNQNDPTARQLAGYQRQVADALEDELGRRGDAAGLVDVRPTLQQARVNFAKLSTLEEAWDGGYVDAGHLSQAANSGGYLTGGLKELADYHDAAPVSTTHTQRIGQPIEPNARAGATPQDMALRSAQFIGGNWLTKQIGKSGVKSFNQQLRDFAPPPKPAAMEPPAFEFERAPGGPPEAPPSGPGAPPPPAGPTGGPPPAASDFAEISDELANAPELGYRQAPRFGPQDEFPGPQSPPPAPPESGVVSVTPTEHMVYHNGQVDGPYTTRDSADLVHAYLAEKNPAPVDNVSDMLTLYRGQPEGTANEGFFAPDRATAERYGPSVSEQQMNPADVQHAGSIEDLRALTGLGPDATIEDLVQAYKALPDRKKAVSWDLPPDMSGTPREYYKFGE